MESDESLKEDLSGQLSAAKDDLKAIVVQQAYQNRYLITPQLPWCYSLV